MNTDKNQNINFMIKNESLFIAGGVGNLGNVVVDALQQQNYQMHLAVRSLEGVKEEDQKSYYHLDLSDEVHVSITIDEIIEKSNTPFYAGIFMTGGYVYGGYAETTLHMLNRMIQLNFETVFPSAKKLLELFEKQQHGKLIFIGAKVAQNPSMAAPQLAYSLSKQMLYNFTEIINSIHSGAKISAHIILPGTLDTPLNREQMPDADFSKWSSPSVITQTIIDLLQGKEIRNVIEL